MYTKVGFISDEKMVFNSLEARNTVMYNSLMGVLLASGMIEDAHKLFQGMEKDLVSWSAMIKGLAQNGLEKKAIDFFREMKVEGLTMDQCTFGSVLPAYGGLGAINEGKKIHACTIRTNFQDNIYVGSALIDMYYKCKCIDYAKTVFDRMKQKNVVSWTAMVVGYGQSGRAEEAVKMFLEIQRSGIEPNHYTLGQAISACANLSSLEEGSQFHGKAVVSGLIHYVIVSNSLVTLWKMWIKWKGKLHSFSADDESSPYLDQIYAKLEELNQKIIDDGYIPDTTFVQHDVEEAVKVKMLNYHSERLAIAFGLIFVPSGLPIRVGKNLRVCVDCHTATKHISSVTGREIIVRDAVRFHRFKDGTCSCGDFW